MDKEIGNPPRSQYLFIKSCMLPSSQLAATTSIDRHTLSKESKNNAIIALKEMGQVIAYHPSMVTGYLGIKRFYQMLAELGIETLGFSYY